ncbi:efflux RND transporter permease subunit [Roseospira visakhapatnamensis]|uniref:Multidrug efflux pump subunit AcrB n=1 Tax=Roseospira visakhapatnamensis TaxID=390880 RepID=A0A7W6RFL6_9PROT|nr:efflux RND transporter permease subunit [Roseospira visakhapatnamensis]MBB4267387.1 multidrug efflux pump subunit AcrB [Roseospira visakhapatnamensis]
MDVARTSIEKPVNTWLIVLICLLGGLYGLLSVGRLEDPAFTIKEAKVITAYPGASAVEVEEEITEPLESAIQQLGELDSITSVSRPGISEITVEIQDIYKGDDLAQIWDELRRKVADARGTLPENAGTSQILDDYGDVFGIYYAVTAPGYSDLEIIEIAKELRREVLTVPGVAKVETAGEPTPEIHIEIGQDKLARLGVSLNEGLTLLDVENAVQPNGMATIGDERVRLSVTDAFDSVEAVETLMLGTPGSTAMVRLRDVATVGLGRQDPPDHLIRFNGAPAVTLAVAAIADANVVDVGQAVRAKLDSLTPVLPVGVEIHTIYDQATVVDEAVQGFLVNLLASVSIVIGALCLFMGWRAGVVVGSILFLTVFGTVFFLWLAGIELERISLGALIIAMGMLVDNAIVVAEGMLINMRRGQTALRAASEVTRQTQWPLLGATVIGIMAFSGIGLSPDTTGEFLFSLFAVIGISLLLSWILAVMVTPLFGAGLFKQGKPAADGEAPDDPYRGMLFSIYRAVLTGALRHRLLTVLALVGVTAACLVGFGWVKQGFFPYSNTPMFYVNVWMPQGTDIRAVDDAMAEAERYILDQPGVESVSTFVGQGAARFMLTYAPEAANPAFGHMIVRTARRDQIPALIPDIRATLGDRFPSARVFTERLVFGPGGGAKIEARFSGPDADMLRALAAEAEAVFRADGGLQDIRTDWREREKVIHPLFAESRARVAGVSRTDLALTLRYFTDGNQIATFRDGDELIPIIIRAPEGERDDLAALGDRLVWSAGQSQYVPVGQILDGFEVTAEDALIRRDDRVRTLNVQGDPIGDQSAAQVHGRIKDAIEAIPLPTGYTFEWGGEIEDTVEAQTALMSQVPVGFLVMVLITVALFGTVREPLIIWLVVPMSICGVTLGLLGTGLAFDFMSLLGVLSLSGMLIKNAIVLVEEIDLQLEEQTDRFDAVVRAGVSRLRPVVLAAGTTILGMLPLLTDAFFASMAVTISGGLAFATILTLVAVPVLYSLFYGITPPRSGRRASGDGASAPAPAPTSPA